MHSTPANYTPIVTCPRDIDKFTVTTATTGNKALTYPVGLITADEAVMAGAKWNTSNSSYYLYTGQNWWAGSPFYFNGNDAYEFRVDSSGRLLSSGVNGTSGVRPVVSLTSGYKIVSGDGTVNNPYVVA